MALISRRLTRMALVLLALLMGATLWDGYRLYRLQHWNSLIESESVEQTDDAPPAEVRFAEAYLLAAKGDEQGAMGRYRELQDDERVGLAARYNSANVLMRQATALQGSASAGQAIPLLELAKETYREVLRTDPGKWDARYNLERAQRLLPDPQDNEPAAEEAPHGAERAATTMRGFSPGLP